MKIISRFKDYYDHVQGLSYDDSLTLIRQPQELDDKSDLIQKLGIRGPWTVMEYGGRTFEEVHVYFCGRMYTGLRTFVYGKDDQDRLIAPGSWRYFWTVRAFTAYATEHKLPPKNIRLYNPKRLGADNVYDSNNLQKHWLDAKASINAVPEYVNRNAFAENNVAILMAERTIDLAKKVVYTLNPNLGQIQFQQVMPPYQAYQELVMWLGNLAPENKPMVQIEDKYKISEHGFDKWSFRKLPTKRK